MGVWFGKCFWAIIIFFTLICTALPVQAEEKKGDKIVAEEKKVEEKKDDKIAVVNGIDISRKDFDQEMDAVRQRITMQGQKVDDAQLSEIGKNILENLINRELLYQESQKSGSKIDEAAVNEEFESWKKRFPDEATLKNIMTKMNLTEDEVKSQFRQQMTVKQFLDKKFTQITVSDEETKALYDSRPDDFKEPEQVKASHILLKTDPKADDAKKAEARKKMEDVREKLKKGEDFAALAKEISECPSSAKGGNLGYFGRGQMVKPFEDTAFALKVGEVSDIVETRFGYHLIKTAEKKAEKIVAYKDVKDRLEEYLKNEKKNKEVSLYSQKLKENAKIERFLK